MSTEPVILEMRRDYVAEAVEGAIVQFIAVSRFLAVGQDAFATAAFARGVEFVRLASPEVKALNPHEEDHCGRPKA